MMRIARVHPAWLGFWSCVALCLVALPLDLLNDPSDLIITLPPLAIPAVGALIVSRRPEHVIGWLFLGCGITLTIGNVAGSWAKYSLEATSLPGERWMAWLSSFTFAAGFFALVPLLLLYFPSGRLASPRWQPLAWIVVVEVGSLGILLALRPGPFDDYADYPHLTNPLGVPLPLAFDLLGALIAILAPVVVVGPIIALVTRFRHAQGIERSQLKWFTWMALLVVVSFTVMEVVVVLIGDSAWADSLFTIFFIGAVIGLPAAVGVAIVRYQLYDIDHVINRTLVYSALMACLAGAYLASIIGLGAVARLFSGQSSDLVTAASTLAVAALFQPLRTRIQSFVDRHFYRRKYDAAHTVERFSARLRDEIDLPMLSAELRDVVAETMQPAHVSLWLRPARS